MSRFDSAPADGGISLSTQEDEARERADEESRDVFMFDLHRRIDERARAAMHRIGPADQAREVRRIVKDEIYHWLREGVRIAEVGQHAEWILDTECKR
jgi:hypothetical protein